MRKVFGFLALIAGIVVFAAAMESNFTSSTDVRHTVSTTTPAEVAPKWEYSTVGMDAGTKKRLVGCIQSSAKVHLEFPYKDTLATLCLRSDGSAMLSIESGQILTGDNHGARIRFGDAAPRSFSLDQPSDYSSTVAFIVPSGPLFAAARSGKKITVEATYYDAGSQTATFSPDVPLVLK
jgi:hypothetical protein